MNLRRPHLLATAAVVLAIAGTAGASTLTFADFDNTPGNLGKGTLDGVGFTITASGPSDTGLSSIKYRNYNGPQWGSLGAPVQSLETLEYSGQTVTITFDQAVSDLNLWLYSWRAGGNGTSPYGGADNYQFSSTNGLPQDFTLGDNFSNGERDPESSDTLLTPTGWWSDGILIFSGPVTTISWTSYEANGSTEDTVATQGFTFTGTVSASAVPGAGLAGLATVGLAGVSRRRRG